MSLTAALVALQLKNVYSCIFQSQSHSFFSVKRDFIFFLKRSAYSLEMLTFDTVVVERKKNRIAQHWKHTDRELKNLNYVRYVRKVKHNISFIKGTTVLINQIYQHTEAYITFCRELSLTLFHVFVFAQRRCSDLWDYYQVWVDTISHL